MLKIVIFKYNPPFTQKKNEKSDDLVTLKRVFGITLWKKIEKS